MQTANALENELLSINEVAKALKVSPVTVKRYIANGKIDSIKIGGKRRVYQKALESFVNGNGKETPVPKKTARGSQFYWSQKSADIAHTIYTQNCKPGDVVMDLFLGAGSSLYGAKGLKLRFVGVEINEQPLAITRFNIQKTTPSRLEALQAELDRLTKKYGAYYTLKDKDNNLLIFDRMQYDMNGNKPVIKKFFCINQVGTQIDLSNNDFVVNQFLRHYRTSKSELKKFKPVSLIKNSRIAVKEGMQLSDIFSPVNYVILSHIKNEIKDNADFKFLLGSVLHLVKLTDLRSQSQFPYWVPSSNILDRNIFRALQKKLDHIKKNHVPDTIDEHTDFKQLTRADSGCLLINKPAQHLKKSDVPSNSVDFILTDPPYFDQVAYSEYLKIWEYFLGYKSHLTNEIVVSQRVSNPKTEAAYLVDMEAGFSQAYRILKPGASIWVYFREARPDKIGLFLSFMQKLGFRFGGIEHVDTNKYTYKQNNTSTTSFKGDALYKFTKPVDIIMTDHAEPLKTSPQDVEKVIKDYVLVYGAAHKDFSLGQLIHGGLLEHLYKHGLLQLLKNQRPIVDTLLKICDYDDRERTYNLKMGQILNTLLLGDALSVLQSLPTDSVDTCITDPPYSISSYDHKKEIGWLKSNKYWSESKKFQKIDAEWDKFTDDDYELFTRQWITEIKRVVKPNGNIAIFGSYHNIYKIGHVLDSLGLRINNSLTWYKRNAFPNITQRMFCESTEHIIWAVNNDKKHAKNWTFNYHAMKELNGGKQMRNMFDIPMTSISEKRHGKHPSQKPEKLLDILVRALTNENDCVIDPFLGSGTTAVSCARYGRNFIGIDNSEEYLEIARKRLAALDNLPGASQQNLSFS